MEGQRGRVRKGRVCRLDDRRQVLTVRETGVLALLQFHSVLAARDDRNNDRQLFCPCACTLE